MENEKRREHIDFTTPREREAQLLDMEKGSSWENINDERTRIYKGIGNKDLDPILRIPVLYIKVIRVEVDRIKDAYELGLSFNATEEEIVSEKERLYKEKSTGNKVSIQKYSYNRRKEEAKKLNIRSKNPTWMEIEEKRNSI